VTMKSTSLCLAGASWADRSGLVVTNINGSPPNPEAFSNLFVDLAERAGLPQIRLHDLRHSYATAALASGVPVKESCRSAPATPTSVSP